MSIHRTIGIAALFLLGAIPARATTITFDTLSGVPSSLTTQGFTFLSGGHYHFDLTSSSSFAQDGTTMLWNHDYSNTMFASDNSAFSMQSFWGGEFYSAGSPANSPTIRVIGTFVGGGTVTQDFLLDGYADGNGGLPADMQVFTLSPAFTNLAKVDFLGLVSPGFTNNYYSLDNIVVNGSTVPEPASMMLLGTGLAGVAARLRRRSRRA